MKLQEYITAASTAIEKNKFEGQPNNLYDPLNYIIRLGGKRIRPALALIGYHTLKPDFETAIPLAKAIEYFHNFSLMHDDIMDKSPLRRGQQSVHLKWNEATAILSGDLMLIECYKELTKMKDVLILEKFNQMAEEVCQGQQLDMDFESDEKVTIGQYIEMIRLKTSVLLGKSLSMGALLAHADQILINAFEKFGELIGIGFQIMDDYLDTFGESAKTGKKIGQDILDKKRALPFLLAENTLSRKEKKEFIALFSSYDEEKLVNEVRAIFIDHKIDQQTMDLAKKYFKEAEEILNTLTVDKTALNELVAFLRIRNY